MRKILFSFYIAANICSAQTIENYLSPPFPTESYRFKEWKTIAWVFNDKGSRNIYVAEAPDFAMQKKLLTIHGDDGIEINSL